MARGARPGRGRGGDGGCCWNEGCGDEVELGEEDPFSGVAEVSSGSGEAEEAVEGSAGKAAGLAAAMVCSLKKSDIWRRRVEFLGPRSCCTASRFMPTAMQRRRRQARHWLRCVLSTRQPPSVLDLHTYCRFRRIERCNEEEETISMNDDFICQQVDIIEMISAVIS